MMSAMFKDSRRFAGVKRRRSGVGVNKRGGADKNDANAESEQLPIFKYKSELVRSVKENQITIVCGETGSGKSTQLPQFLASHFTEGCVVCTQPRRVAAITIAQRVAKERHVDLGSEVGYSIRFDDKSCSHTKIKYVTDGVLLREIMSDTELSKYSVVILDEAHERSLQTDILVGLLRQLLERKKTLRVIVMSATLEVRLFATYFNVPAESCIHIKGRQFPVQIMYTPSPEPDFIEACLLTCLQIHEESDGCDFGGVLVFLPGQEDIENLQLLLREHLMVLFKEKHERIYSMTAKVESTGDTNIEKARSQPNGVHVDFNDGDEVDFIVLPLYASMNPDDQLKAFQPSYPGKRKFVLATNIAETSVTIPGIQYVIDPGKMKSRRMHPATGADMLQVAAVSQAQANQRAGRAGRERAGTCFRLFTEDTFEQLDESSTPEVQRIGIAQVILQLFVIGVENPLAFPFPSPPSTQSLQKTLKHLLRLGAISKERKITRHGRNLAKIPLHPSFAHLLLCSKQFGCVEEVLTAVSMLSSDNIFIQPHNEKEKAMAGKIHQQFSSRDGDFVTLINIYDAFLKSKKSKGWCHRSYLSHRGLSHACSIREQLLRILQTMGIEITSCSPEREPVLKCIVKGLSRNIAGRAPKDDIKGGKNFVRHSNGVVAMKENAPYRTIEGNQDVYIHPSSSLFSKSGLKLPKHVVYAEILVTTKCYMRFVSVMNIEWLSELEISHIKTLAVQS